MTIPLLVPSKNRPNSSTLQMLLALGDTFPEWQLVLEPQDVAKYHDANPSLDLASHVLVLPDNDPGLPSVRQWILTHASERSYPWFWMLDDDITGVYERVGKKNVARPLPEVLAGAESIFLSLPQVAQAALEYQQYAWSTTKDYVLNSYCDVFVCIHTERAALSTFREEVLLKLDRDFTMQLIASGYKTCRVQRYSFACPTNGSNKGGLYDVYHKDGIEWQNSQRMEQLWGSSVCKAIVKPNGRPDCKINWRALSSGQLQ